MGQSLPAGRPEDDRILTLWTETRQSKACITPAEKEPPARGFSLLFISFRVYFFS
jgi:hypothetical protein